jgi:amino acid adenylation domain-containing protein
MENLLLKLSKRNIAVKLADGNLKLNIPKGHDVNDILKEIKDNKEALIAFINKRNINNNKSVIVKADSKDFYALSSAQKRLHFLYEFDKKSLAYNMPKTVRLTGQIDKIRLNQVFKQLVARHESLRTIVIVVDEVPVQKIVDDFDLIFEQFNVPEPGVTEIIRKFIRPFDLSQGPLIRTGLIQLSENEHILIVDMHHIVTDGVSDGLLIKDFMALYNKETLPELNLQYKDYAVWQQSEYHQNEILRQKKFWLNLFEDELTTIELPTNFKRPNVLSYRGNSIGFSLGVEQSQLLKNISEQSGCTMFMVILSIYYIFLNKITNQEDIVIGTPVAGRPHADLENVIGMFVNTLPLRNHINGKLTFSEFLEIVKTRTLSCFQNQDYQYESLLDELKVVRDTSRNPLFDVMFSYQNYEESELIIPGLKLSPYNSGHKDSKFDLSLNATEDKGQIYLAFEYSIELFREESINRFIGYFKKIVTEVTSNFKIKCSAIEVLNKIEKYQLMVQFNNSFVQYSTSESIVDLFENQILSNGSAEAIKFKDQSISYDELNEKVNQLSHYLVNTKGIYEEVVIGIYVDRSPKMIVALLAVLKAGASYIFIDPEYPNERIRKIIDDSQLKLVITNLFDQLASINLTTDYVDLIKEKDLIDFQPIENPRVSIQENYAAYTIYTSGSTGVPKGVVIEHATLLDYCLTFIEYFSLTNDDRVIQQSSLSFDTSVEEIFPALISGASLIIMPSGGRDVEFMIKSIEINKATVLSTTPLVLNELNNSSNRIDSLRVIISGGDLLLPKQINKLINRFTIYNTYGPTESTVCVTYNKIEDLSETSLIGKPISNREVFITNNEGKLCPLTVSGEICVGGKGLARGYLNNQELTLERFIESDYLKKRVYRTGDLGRWLPNGKIEFLGRIDDQVKIRGYRIELGEIECKLIEHGLVNEVAVVSKEHNGNKILVAYYTSENEIETDILSSYLSEKLPDYMIPVFYVCLAKMPLTSTGKLNKKALPEPEIKLGEDYVAPSNEIEEKLVQIWSEVLKVDKGLISINRSFFELGGHSLKAITLTNKLYKVFNVEISLREIFNNATIKLMAQNLEVQFWLNNENHKEVSAETNKIII